MRQLQNVYVRNILPDGRVHVVWRHEEIHAISVLGMECIVPAERTTASEFQIGQRAQAVVETTENIVVRLIRQPGMSATVRTG